MIGDREVAELRARAGARAAEDPVCRHGFSREDCIFCGAWAGKVFAARCDRCAATTWHHFSDGACVRCGTPA
jgi:hypothetical protein